MEQKFFKTFFLFFLFLGDLALCSTTEELMTNLFVEGVTVDLKEPTFTDGILSTTCGGVIKGPDLRIQAMTITYTRKTSTEGQPVFNIVAEGELILEYHNYILVGTRLEYDFQTKTGIVYNGRTAMDPWYFGGKEIELLPDGSIMIYDGYITTSEHSEPDWQIHVEEALLNEDQYLKAKHVKLQFVKLPVLWLPYFHADLQSIFDAPLKYRVRWGGSQGPRMGVIYELFNWRRFTTFLRLDYRLDRGPGFGVNTEYDSPDGKEVLMTSSYVARDSSIEEPNERFRYRFQGTYSNVVWNDNLSIDLTYDKLSDNQMETDYFERGLELDTAKQTQLLIRQQQNQTWISNFITRVRINNFQTVKQELPSLVTTFHPFKIGPTGIISENRFELGYLDFVYENNLINVQDYSASRFEFCNRLYRPFSLGPVNHTPEIGVVGIFYGNGPRQSSDWLYLGTLGYGVNMQISKIFDRWKHAIEPYATYQYYTFPTVNPNQHFIFDIEDAWYRLNIVRFGCRNLLYYKREDGIITRYLLADIYANAFFDTPTFPSTIPYIYGRVTWDTLPSLRNTVLTIWDTERNQLGTINFRTDFTFNEDIAVALEYRHRNAFAWRKVDDTNFILESFRNEKELEHSLVSDRRDTVLLHYFYRFMPNWALEFESRHGWNRKFEPSYREYEVDLLTTFASAWHLKISYQLKEDDHRLALYVNFGLHKPCERPNICPVFY